MFYCRFILTEKFGFTHVLVSVTQVKFSFAFSCATTVQSLPLSSQLVMNVFVLSNASLKRKHCIVMVSLSQLPLLRGSWELGHPLLILAP